MRGMQSASNYLAVTLTAWFMLSLSSVLAQSSAPATVPVPLSFLPADARLERSISLKETGTALDELLQKVSDGGLTLKADASCADQKLQLRLKKRPLRVLMQSLAQLLPGEWQPLNDNKGYKLYMTQAAIRRRKHWWNLYLGEREQALTTMREHVLQQMRATPFRRKPDDPNLEHSNLRIEAMMAERQEFFNLLPASLQEQIAANLIDLPTYVLSGTVAGGYHEELATVVPANTLPPRALELLKQSEGATLFSKPRHIDWREVLLRFNNIGYAIPTSIALPDSDATDTGLLLNFGIVPQTAVLWLNQAPLSKEVQRLSRNAPRAWRELAEYENTRVWSNDPSKQKPNSVPPPRRSDVLQWVTEKGNVEFVADFYSLPGFPVYPQFAGIHDPMQQPLARPLKEELDFRAAEQDTSWKQTADKVYLFRDNRWYRDDNLEAPAPLVKKWLEKKTSAQKTDAKLDHKTPWSREQIQRQLEWEVEVTNALTVWQIANGMAWYTPYTPDDHPIGHAETINGQLTIRDVVESFPFRHDVDRIFYEYHTVRFYAKLSVEARLALLEARLPFATLSPDQQQEALALLPAFNLGKVQDEKRATLLGIKSNIGTEIVGWDNPPRARLYVVTQASPQSSSQSPAEH